MIRLCLSILALLFAAIGTLAQPPGVVPSGERPAGPPAGYNPALWSVSLSGMFEQGDRFNRRNADFEVARKFRVAPRSTISPFIELQRDEYHDIDPALGLSDHLGSDRQKINRQEVGFNLSHIGSNGYALFGRVSAESAWAPDASPEDSLSYLALGSIAKRVNPMIDLGFGLALTKGLEEDAELFPIPVIRLRLGPKWKVGSEKGLGLQYLPNPKLRFGVSATFDTTRFRLAKDAPLSEGIVEMKSAPVYITATYRPDLKGGPTFTARLGSTVWTDVDVDDKDGNRVDRYDDFDPGIMGGLRVLWKF